MKTALNNELSAISAIEEWIKNGCETVDPNIAYQSRQSLRKSLKVYKICT